MKKYVVKVLNTTHITHDVKYFVVEKPAGYNYHLGQATLLSIKDPEWEDELRPFTITSLNEQDHLEFIIKLYHDHEGVTNRLSIVNAGDELIVHDVIGAIQYKGPGVFIAGGTGITPFISIFRDLHRKHQITGNRLIYSNKTKSDVILEEELSAMLGNDFVKIFTREMVPGYHAERIDRNYLINNIKNFRQNFYVCGQHEFTMSINGFLKSLGAKSDKLVFD